MNLRNSILMKTVKLWQKRVSQKIALSLDDAWSCFNGVGYGRIYASEVQWRLTNNTSYKIEILGSILEWLTSIVAQCILAVKVVHRKLEFSDNVPRRKRSRELKELIKSIKGNCKAERKGKAIERNLRIPKPETVFSSNKYCSATNNGNGKFKQMKILMYLTLKRQDASLQLPSTVNAMLLMRQKIYKLLHWM